MRKRIALLLLFTLSSCGDAIKNLSGSFTGYLLVNSSTSSDVVATVDQGQAFKTRVIDLELLDKRTKVVIQSLHIAFNGNDLILNSTLFPVDRDIRLVRSDICAVGSTSQFSRIEACLSESTITLRALSSTGPQSVYLFLSNDKSPSATDPSTPAKPQSQPYDLASLLKRVKTSNFDSMLKAERVYQARQAIQAARGNLLPRLNMRDVIAAGLAVIDPASLGELVGDVVPFIFPSRWYALDQSNRLYQAEQYSYASLVANQMNEVEGLYYSVLNDQIYYGSLTQYRAYLKELYDLALNLERASGAPRATSLILSNRLIDTDSDISDLSELLSKQYASLSVSVGLSPVEGGVSSLVPISAPSIGATSKITSDSLVANSLSSALEIKELLYLEQAAKSSLKTVAYSFLDPQSDPSLSFGFGYAANLDISRSKISEIEIRTASTKTTVQRQVINIVALVNRIVDQYLGVVQGVANSKQLLTFTVQKMEREGLMDGSDLLSSVDTLLKFELKQAQLESAYMMAQAKLNRLLLTGPYADVLSLTPSPPAVGASQSQAYLY